ncbi:MAG TPA: permease [Intrasporangium sp.]|uniref:permease n=1 Tax=Intrasporangium sp. TaxID=1925024 RepID=UPI002D7963E5|nr:permease [Intrasporangium sp.]HET7398825.1 permease [Intrasporangium sp.]
MSSSLAAPPSSAAASRRRLLRGALLVLGVAVVGLAWAKWLPYSAKAADLAGSRSWTGSALTRVAADASTWWQGAWAFTVAYAAAVWKAVLVGLVLAAAVSTLLPRAWLAGVLARRGPWRGSVLAGVASLPSMMCSCCTAPLAVSLRRSGVPVGPAVAYWLGNPVLNPAVLVFLALVGPWQWAAVRVVVGVVLVLGAGAAVARLTTRGGDPGVPSAVDATLVGMAGSGPAGEPGFVRGAASFGRELLRLSATLLPEYAVLVFALGAAAHVVDWQAGWLTTGLVGLLALVVVATLMVIPTGGEIPVALALAALGASPWAVGVVLVALPALSLVSMVMVARALTWRITAATAGAVAVASVLAGGLLAGTS